MSDQLMQDILSTVAAGYDSMHPGTGDVVREFAEQKYSRAEFARHLSNLCDRHKRELLPAPTAPVCIDCAAERARQG